jgi:acetyl-CoA carboxylase carboxyl transferase subunit beta
MVNILRCPACDCDYSRAELIPSFLVCPSCGHHFRMEPYERLDAIADTGSFRELWRDLSPNDPLLMAGYAEKVASAARETGLSEAVIAGTCMIESQSAVIAVMSFSFIGGSIGTVVGERIARAMREGVEKNCPVVIFATSGGARMQEGVQALMQMVKTSSAAWLLDRARVPLFVFLCDPTSGGAIASFAMLGDVIAAEPGAFVGFQGPRVIEKTISGAVPAGFQSAERQLEHGFVDCIVPRSEQRAFLSRMIKAHSARGSS